MTGATISARDTEKRRGRPPDLILEELRPIVAALFPEDRSPRAIANRCYSIHAIRALDGLARVGWIFDAEAATAGRFEFPFGVLAELGRFRDPRLIRAFALAIVERDPRPTIGDAAEILRRVRHKNTLRQFAGAVSA